MKSNYIQLFRIFENEQGEEIVRHYHELMGYITSFEKEIFENWKKQVVREIQNDIAKPLLKKNSKGELFVNFSEEVK